MMHTLQRILLEMQDPFRSDEEWSILDAITNVPHLAAHLPVRQVRVKDLIETQKLTGAGITSDIPIIVLERGDGTFVIDGHHRLKSAKQRRASYIAAHVLIAHQPLTLVAAAAAMHVSQHDILNAMHPNDRARYASVRE